MSAATKFLWPDDDEIAAAFRRITGCPDVIGTGGSLASAVRDVLATRLTALERERDELQTHAATNLTGCCRQCGTAPVMGASRVNDIWCINLAPRCSCNAGFNLWPRSARAALTSSRETTDG